MAGQGSGIDHVDLDIDILQQRVDDCAFGRFDGDCEGGTWDQIPPGLDLIGNRLGPIFKDVGVYLAVGRDEVEVMLRVGPVNSDRNDG